jgi:putative acetyltransferase
VNTDNDRAVRFYRKHGFEITGADVSLISRRPVHKMSWRGDQAPSNCSLARRA